MPRMFASTAATLALVAASVGGGDPVKLAWNFDVGDQFSIERTVKQKEIVEAKQKHLRETANRWLSSALVKQKSSNGYVLELTFDSVERKVTDLLRKTTVAEKLVEKMKGAKLTITMSAQGNISKMEGYDGLIKQMAAGEKAEFEKVLRTLVPEESIRESLEDVFAWIPAKPVSKGDRWQRQGKELLGEFGHLLMDFDLAYQGLQMGRHQVAADITVKLVPPSDDANPNKLFKVTKAGLKAVQGKASFSMSLDGKSMEGTKKIVINGALEVELGTKRNILNLANETAVTMRVFSKDDKNTPKKK